jgi:hypothetical protein
MSEVYANDLLLLPSAAAALSGFLLQLDIAGFFTGISLAFL